MFITSHAAAGAIIGELLPTHPFLAFFISFFSHFVMDSIPHGDTGVYKGYISGSKINQALVITSIDGSVAVLLTALLFSWKGVDAKFSTFMGIAGGVLPDLLVGLYELTRAQVLRWFHRFHFFFHNLISGKVGDLALPAGLSLELVVLGLLVFKLA